MRSKKSKKLERLKRLCRENPEAVEELNAFEKEALRRLTGLNPSQPSASSEGGDSNV